MNRNKECPLIPMAAITGAPSREFLFERLKKWKSVGVSQFMIYPRSGLELEYMSEAWLDRCEWICEDAAALGFTSIWIYDEKNWPSGTCDGAVLRENPDFAIQALCIKETSQGEYEILIRRGDRMADLFNPDAVNAFIRLTHERYEKRLGRYFGSLIKGFFSDEPDIAFFGNELWKAGYVRMIPYYNGLEEEYRQLTGGELREDILRGLHTGSEFYQPPCNRLIAKRFRASYSERLSRWCAERGMLLTGHLMNEYCASAALNCNGHILEVLSGFSFPGIDDIFTHLLHEKQEYLTFGTGMYAIEKRGNRGGMAELFALGPCDMTLEKMCSEIWFCAAFGIDRYLLAVAQTEMRGNAEKTSYFNPLSETQPWHEAFRELGTEAKTAAQWARKKRVCEVAVRYPYEPEPLTDLLRHLSDVQLGWRLVLPDEPTDADVVIQCAKGILREERSRTEHFDFNVLYSDLLDRLPRSLTVCENDGTLARKIFLRRYEDGSALVFNLSGRERNLILKTGGKTIPFHLYAAGFYIYDPAALPEKTPENIFDLPEDGWEITLDSPNTMRGDFADKKCVFTLEEDLPELRLCIRNCGEPVEILLDGRNVCAEKPCGSLPQGFRELYLETEPFSLARGEHALTLVHDTADYPYLPAVFLTGRFAGTAEKHLSVYRNGGERLFGYAGRLKLSRRVRLPAGTDAIRAETNGLCAELFINGKSLGRRIRNPFRWIFPEQRSGEVEIALVLSTSCGPLFGQKAFENPSGGLWLKAYSPHNGEAVTSYRKKP